MTRDKIFLVTPDHQVVKMATQNELEKVQGSVAAMERRDNMMHDSINYFPAGTTRPCRIGFFTDPGEPVHGPVYDHVNLAEESACMGRVFFRVPGGIQLGNYNLDVLFENSVIRVPMEIMTKEKAKEFEKKWRESQYKAIH